jgi:hypothetical protein
MAIIDTDPPRTKRYISNDDWAYDLYLNPINGTWWIEGEEVGTIWGAVKFGIWRRWQVLEGVSVAAADAVIESDQADALLDRVKAGYSWDYGGRNDKFREISYTDDARLAVLKLAFLAEDAGIISFPMYEGWLWL